MVTQLEQRRPDGSTSHVCCSHWAMAPRGDRAAPCPRPSQAAHCTVLLQLCDRCQCLCCPYSVREVEKWTCGGPGVPVPPPALVPLMSGSTAPGGRGRAQRLLRARLVCRACGPSLCAPSLPPHTHLVGSSWRPHLPTPPICLHLNILVPQLRQSLRNLISC